MKPKKATKKDIDYIMSPMYTYKVTEKDIKEVTK
jgi:hypothetical protein